MASFQNDGTPPNQEEARAIEDLEIAKCLESYDHEIDLDDDIEIDEPDPGAGASRASGRSASRISLCC